MALSGDGWIRRFLVTEPQRHRKGFTVYKVTSIVYPKASPEAITKVVVWKRYNDFKKLHRELQQRHQKLYLKDTFPPFSKSTLFGRFEEEVVEERRICALRLLEFAAEHPPLFTSQLFVKFFESGYTMNAPRHEEQQALIPFMDEAELFGDPLLPDPVLRPLQQTPRLASEDSLDPSLDTVSNDTVMLGGTWHAPRAAVEDSLSLGSSLSSECDEGHTSDTDTPQSESCSPGKEKSGGDLLQFFDPLCEETPEEQTKETVETNSQLLSSLDQDTQEQLAPSPSPRNSRADSCHGAGYIFEAACQVSQAQQHEANAHYEGAFAFYKAGIAILLSGVQGDEDAIRRQIVKDKTAKYLKRAEYIYNMHLTAGERKAKWTACMLARPAAELCHYKVLGILDRCMLVTNLATQECCVLKALYKSPCPTYPDAELIIPQTIPYMVQLLRYHETEGAIFLVLQHASGGKLWDHLSAYINTVTQSATRPVSQKNVYLGQKLLLQDENEEYCSVEAKNCNIPTDNATEDLPPLAQDLTDEDVNMNRADCDGYVTFSNSEVDENLGRNGINKSARFSWMGLDTAELVQNAQKLLQSVSATLQRSEKVAAGSLARSEKPSAVTYVVSGQEGASRGVMSKCPSAEGEEERARVRRRSASGRSRSSTAHLTASRARVIERRYSCDDLLEGRGSLEVGSRRGSRPLEFSTRPRLPEATVRQWASQLVLALEALHACGVIYRDMRPDNLLLGSDGRVLLTFTAQWPNVDAVVNNQATETMYAAPETRGITPVSTASDWWSLGALLYELLIGKTLVSCHPGGIHSHTLIYLPDWLSPEAKSILTELLKPDPYERLGSGSHGMENLKSHPFFNGVQWERIREAGLMDFQTQNVN